MKFSINSRVRGFSPQQIIEVFDFDLLRELSPPLMKPHALIYEGNRPGSRIHFRLATPSGVKNWIGKIDGYGESENEIWFSDEGIEIPFGIKTWKHKHRLMKTDYGTIIRDEVEVEFIRPWTALFKLPGIWLQFIYRKTLYEKIITRRLKN